MSNGIKRKREESEYETGGLTRADIEKAAGPIVTSTLALQRERDAAIEAYNELFEKAKQLEIDLAGETQKVVALTEMLRLTEERKAVNDAEYRNQLATYTNGILEGNDVHAREITQLKLDLQHTREQLDGVITACLNVLKQNAVKEAPAHIPLETSSAGKP